MSIEVRQNELIVLGNHKSHKVEYLFTLGLSPCVGLTLWCEQMCVVAHFDTWESIPYCKPVVDRFAAVSAPKGRKARIVRAIGNPVRGAAWHSEHMASDLLILLEQSKVQGEEVRPVALGECVNAWVRTENGNATYAGTNRLSLSAQRPDRRPATEGDRALATMVDRPTSIIPRVLLIGVYEPAEPAGQIRYALGSSEGEVAKLLS